MYEEYCSIEENVFAIPVSSLILDHFVHLMFKTVMNKKGVVVNFIFLYFMFLTTDIYFNLVRVFRNCECIWLSFKVGFFFFSKRIKL